MILLDTSGLLAALVADEPAHKPARKALDQARPPLILSPFVLAELDYLVARRRGVAAEVALLGEIASGVYDLVPFLREDVDRAADVIDRYSDLGIGLTDASIVVLSERFGADRVLTLDERHFRTLRTPDGRPFVLLPADG